jgi:hypothetical protein
MSSSSEKINPLISQESSSQDSSSNIYIYTALGVLTIAVIYILYKQSTSNKSSEDAIKSAATAAVTSTTENANYATKSDLTTTKSELNALITTGSTTGTVKIPGAGGMFAHLPAYGSWFGNTLASGGAIAWTNNTTTGITEPVGITYNSSNGSFTFTYPGLYKVSFNSNKFITARNPANDANRYEVGLYLNETQIEAIGSTNNINHDWGNMLTSHIDNVVRITNSTDYLRLLILHSNQPNSSYLSIHWIGS